jgi:hypothetical protein
MNSSFNVNLKLNEQDHVKLKIWARPLPWTWSCKNNLTKRSWTTWA